MVVNDVSYPNYYGPEPALVEFLEKEGTGVVQYINNISYGRFVSEISNCQFDKPKSVSAVSFPFFKSYLFSSIMRSLSTFRLVLKSKQQFDVYFGTRGLNALVGLVLKRLGRVRTVVYYAHTYSKSSSPIIRVLDNYTIRSVDLVWSLSRRLTKILDEMGVLRKKPLWVPVGIHREEIGRPLTFPKSSDAKKLVYVGVLTPDKGLGLIIDALPMILERVPDAELNIVGGGVSEGELRKKVQELHLEKCVNFLGYMEYKTLMQFLETCHIGLAPYNPTADNTAWTTDPLKPKLYMASGLPVVITNFPETAAEVQDCKAGLVISYDRKELAEAVVKLFTDNVLFGRCSMNAIKFAENYEWGKIFRKAFCASRLFHKGKWE